MALRCQFIGRQIHSRTIHSNRKPLYEKKIKEDKGSPIKTKRGRPQRGRAVNSDINWVDNRFLVGEGGERWRVSRG